MNIASKAQEAFIRSWKNWRNQKDERLSTEFLPEALEIIEKPPTPLGRTMIWIVLLILACALVWSCLGKVDEVAVARGKVISIDHLQIVQPMREGTIAEFYVEEGSPVTAGQKLLRLDSTISKIQYENAQNNIQALSTKNELLESFLSGEDISEYLKQNMPNAEQKIGDYVISLQKDYKVKKRQCLLDIQHSEEMVEIQEQEQKKIQDTCDTLRHQKKLLVDMDDSVEPDEQMLRQIDDALEFATQEAANYKDLYDGGAVSEYEWRVKQNQVQSLQAEYEVQQKKVEFQDSQKDIQLEQLNNQISEAENNYIIQEKQVQQAKDQLEKSKAAMENLNTETETSIIKTMVDNNIQIDNMTSEVLQIQEQLDMETLYSPVDGIIQTMVIKTVGGVVTPAQQLITIAPTGTQIMIEASLLNKDIGFVQCGQSASVKLDTYPFQQYGMADGTVVSISPDSELNDKKQLVFKIKVALDSNKLQANGKSNPIVSGMEGTVEVKTGKRRIIEFFLDPFIKNLDESLKVR